MVDQTDWPLLDRHPDPLPEMAHDAVRIAYVDLMRDLWQQSDA